MLAKFINIRMVVECKFEWKMISRAWLYGDTEEEKRSNHTENFVCYESYMNCVENFRIWGISNNSSRIHHKQQQNITSSFFPIHSFDVNIENLCQNPKYTTTTIIIQYFLKNIWSFGISSPIFFLRLFVSYLSNQKKHQHQHIMGCFRKI